MAHVDTQDIALIDAGAKADGARSARAKARQVEEFYDLGPQSEVILPDVFREARQLRDTWRRERYSRLRGS
jgi:hypothetical protein